MMEKLYKFFYRDADEDEIEPTYTQKEKNYFWMGINFGALIGTLLINVILWGMIAIYPAMF